MTNNLPIIIGAFTKSKYFLHRNDNLMHIIASVFFVYGNDKIYLKRTLEDRFLGENYGILNIRKLRIVLVLSNNQYNNMQHIIYKLPFIDIKSITYETFFNGFNLETNKSYLDA